MKKNSYPIIGIFLSLLFGISAFKISEYESCNTTKRTKPCNQCPHYTKEIERLNKEIENNKLVIEQIEKDYYILWEENQVFASMLSEIEGSKEGHDELKYLFNKYKPKEDESQE